MTELEEPLVTCLVHRVVLPEAKRAPKRAADAAARFPKVLAVLEGALADREWLAGGRFTVADLNVESVLLWTKMAGLDLDGAPRAAAWLARCIARPALARAQRR
jgi:glutathione S-transferase